MRSSGQPTSQTCAWSQRSILPKRDRPSDSISTMSPAASPMRASGPLSNRTRAPRFRPRLSSFAVTKCQPSQLETTKRASQTKMIVPAAVAASARRERSRNAGKRTGLERMMPGLDQEDRKSEHERRQESDQREKTVRVGLTTKQIFGDARGGVPGGMSDHGRDRRTGAQCHDSRDAPEISGGRKFQRST